MTHVLVTGAAGYVASRLLHRHLFPLAQEGRIRLTLTDRDLPSAPESISEGRVRCVASDLSDPMSWHALLSDPVDLVFHLAGIVSGRAEVEFEAGRNLNLMGTLAGLDRLGQQRPQRDNPVRFIYASSIAVFGTPLPAQIDEQTPTHPSLSYGVHKRMIELMLHDLSRRDLVDARALRLSGVVVRPPSPNGALSGFNSDIIREPLEGREFLCPVSPSACIWLMSSEVAADQLWALSQLSLSEWSTRRALHGREVVVNAPSWPLRISTLMQALGQIDPQAPSRIRFDPQAPLQAQFGNWPEKADFSLGQALGLPCDVQRFDGQVPAFLMAALSRIQSHP